MSSLLPDCGVLSSPSLTRKEVNLPTMSSPSAMLGAGASVNFYGSPKARTPTAVPYNPPSSVVHSRVHRRAAGTINRGVGHGIKKPSLKAKNRAKKAAKVVVRRLKQVKPPPRLAEHRSPTVRPSSLVKSRRQLSSPGKSLLDSPECGDNFMPAKHGEGKKIFTSRARTAATVQITKNVTLSANYGEVSLHQRAGPSGLKKNIGRNTTEKPELVTSAAPSTSVSVVSSASLVESNKPKPTRFLACSPVSKRGEAEKENVLGTASVRCSPRRRQVGTPPAAARAIYQVSPAKRSRSPSSEVAPQRSSPRRQAISPMKSHNTPTKTNKEESLRTSVLRQSTPTKCLLPTRCSPRKSSNNSSPVKDSSHEAEQRPPLLDRSPKVNSPSRGTSYVSPMKHGAQSSPSRVMTRDSPLRSKQLKSTEAAESGEVEQSEQSSSQNSDASVRSDALKYFPIFDPERRRSHAENDKLASNTRRIGGIRAARGDSCQMMLDAGQQDFGATQCKDCGLVYEHADPDDEALHNSYHNRVINALSYSNWKKERQISAMDSHGGRCILVSPGDPHYCWRKVEDVLSVVDEELGFESNRTIKGQNMKAVLYVTDGKVVGLLIAEPISDAYRVVPDAAGASHGEALLCCSEQPQPVKFGISRLWVQKDKRRCQLATKLVDAFRGHMIMYHYLKLDEFAFSDPTPNGLNFARKYTAKENFLVYRHGV